jgi:hypothetical protein
VPLGPTEGKERPLDVATKTDDIVCGRSFKERRAMMADEVCG